MSLIDRVLSEPEFESAPPVLVDVGAAGGVPKRWRRIARHCVAVAFEPDAREAQPLTMEQRAFRRWVYVPAVVVAEPPAGGRTTLHLARSPQCSSTLPPASEALRNWAFASFFDVVKRREFPAITLEAALEGAGLCGLDWLKCDTQGTDLRIFRSLRQEWRQRVLLAEFEPGLIDAYEGEDTLAQVLEVMRHEPFWLADFSIERTPRAMEAWRDSAWYRRLAPSAPGWGNLRYLRECTFVGTALDRRACLLLWVFATLSRQPAFAAAVATTGRQHFGENLFEEMARYSARQVRWSMLGRLPRWVCERLLFRG